MSTKTPPPHPMQPIVVTDQGLPVFKSNSIVVKLLELSGLNLNDISLLDAPQEDVEQFLQLTGTSIRRYVYLDEVSEMSALAAEDMMKNGVSSEQAQLQALAKQMDSVKNSLKIIIPEIFKIHPDDIH